MKQLSREQAIAFGKTGEWKTWTPEQIFAFQIQQDKLCVDFSAFHEATEKALGRPVFTHEFARPDLLVAEFLGVRKKPSLDEIMEQIPKEKILLYFTENKKLDE